MPNLFFVKGKTSRLLHDLNTTAALTAKQEAHGPHRSPEKTVQINKHIRLHHNMDLETFIKHY